MIKGVLFIIFLCHATLSFSQVYELQKAEVLFSRHCSSCHNFINNGIGPHLGGVGERASKEWLIKFIKNPKKLIEKKDKRALGLLESYGTVMPTFSHLQEKELQQLVEYISQKAPPPIERHRNFGLPIKDPIPEKVVQSTLVLAIEPFAQIPASSSENPRARIALMKPNPATNNSFMADQRGQLYRMDKNKAELLIDLHEVFPSFTDTPGLGTGLGAFAFHPDFAKNGLFYTSHSEPPHSQAADFSYEDSIGHDVQWVVSEWKIKDPFSFSFDTKPRELLRLNMVSGMHGVQEIAFKMDATPEDEEYGLLYIAVGDGGAVEKGYPFLTQSDKTVLGTLLRINPMGRNSTNGKYGIPRNNPFVGRAYQEEIYCLGFRNPHRMTWTTTGKLLVANIGQNSVESIFEVKAGANYGWPYREGRLRLDEQGDLNQAYSIPEEESLSDYNLPALEIDHDEITAISTILEYTGTNIPSLNKKVVFTSISESRLFFVNASDLNECHRALAREFRVAVDGKVVTFNELTGNKWRADLRIGKDAKGELYFFTKHDGMVYKAVHEH